MVLARLTYVDLLCWICREPTPSRRAKYCSHACRELAYRQRRGVKVDALETFERRGGIMDPKHCLQCGALLVGRSTQRWCSPACRQLAYRARKSFGVKATPRGQLTEIEKARAAHPENFPPVATGRPTAFSVPLRNPKLPERMMRPEKQEYDFELPGLPPDHPYPDFQGREWERSGWEHDARISYLYQHDPVGYAKWCKISRQWRVKVGGEEVEPEEIEEADRIDDEAIAAAERLVASRQAGTNPQPQVTPPPSSVTATPPQGAPPAGTA